MVIRESIAKRVRKAQHPLTNRHARNDMIHCVRREVGHAFAAAARAETAALAGQRDQPLTAAGAAAEAAQSMLHDAAVFEGIFDKPRYTTVLAGLR